MVSYFAIRAAILRGHFHAHDCVRHSEWPLASLMGAASDKILQHNMGIYSRRLPANIIACFTHRKMQVRTAQ